MVKIKVLAAVGLLAVGGVHGQNLFTYGKYAVSAQAFKDAFYKNAPDTNRRQAMEAYLPLYTAYRLKLQHAYDLRMDPLPTQRQELERYRQQLQESFLKEKGKADDLVAEALQRSQQDIELGHLMIAFTPQDSASQKAAEAQASRAYAHLKAGKPFGQVVEAFSTDAEQKASQGYAGWITVFTLPYVYENAIYALPVGGYTQPITGSNAVHIFLKKAERPARGKIKVAHLQRYIPANAPVALRQQEQRLADSLYQALQAGADFGQLALRFSTDRSSYSNGGLLPEFGVAQYSQAFEDAAFSLTSPGQLTRPFATEYGLHILKLIRRIPPAKNAEEDAEQYAALQAAVFNDKRMEARRQQYLRSQLPKMGYAKLPLPEPLAWQWMDSVQAGKQPATLKGISPQTALFKLGNQLFTLQQYAQYVRQQPKMAPPVAADYRRWMDGFVLQQAEAYYQQNLERYEPAFAAQLQEFKDANLLFEAMEQEVWAKAAADEQALKKYYTAHAAQYTWPPSARVLVCSGADSLIMATVYHQIKANAGNWRTILQPFTETVMADSLRMAQDQLLLPAGPPASAGLLTPLHRQSPEDMWNFTYIFEMITQPGPRTYEEARGLVVNDYQNLLEEQWLNRLRKKYPVTLNQAVWRQLLAAESLRK